MQIEPLTFARAQMAMSLGFHMVFAAIGIGLPLLLVISEAMYLRTLQSHYLQLTKKWAKATGLLFAIGAVSGTALAFELGLLWPRYMEITGAVVGHLFALEGFAFFIEAIFIGLYLYGWDRLSPRAHWYCSIVIACSGAISGILVLGVNTWMQLPVGFTLSPSGIVTVTDPVAILKRFGWFAMALHSTLSCYMSVGFAGAGIYAIALLRNPKSTYAKSALRICMSVAAIAGILQPLSGDSLAKFVFQTQPVKFAAMEMNYETQSHAPLHVGTEKFGFKIPMMLSILADHDPKTVVKGLNEFPPENRPNVMLTHLAFDVMAGFGTILAGLAVIFWWTDWKKKTNYPRWLLQAALLASPIGFIALEAGWIVTECGRQPWIINGVLRTAQAVTPATGLGSVFAVFTALYILLGWVVIVFMLRLRGPKETAPIPQLHPQAI